MTPPTPTHAGGGGGGSGGGSGGGEGGGSGGGGSGGSGSGRGGGGVGGRSSGGSGGGGGRAQSHVVGVALMLSITVVAMAAVTVGVGSTVDGGVARADADRAADAFARLDAVSRTGPGVERVAFADGSLATERRDLRVLDGDGVVRRVPVDVLVFESGSREVRYLAGAVVRGRPGSAWIATEPPIAVGSTSVLVGAPRLDTRGSVAVGGNGRVELAVDVSHDRATLPQDAYRLAIETETPGAWTRYFEALGATVDTRDFDGDGVESVVATFPGSCTLHLVVHALALEVHA